MKSSGGAQGEEMLEKPLRTRSRKMVGQQRWVCTSLGLALPHSQLPVNAKVPSHLGALSKRAKERGFPGCQGAERPQAMTC